MPKLVQIQKAVPDFEKDVQCPGPILDLSRVQLSHPIQCRVLKRKFPLKIVKNETFQGYKHTKYLIFFHKMRPKCLK